MTAGYLLDTNSVCDLVRNPNGRVAEYIARLGPEAVCTSIVVASELRHGVEKRGSDRLRRQMELILGAIEILPLDAPSDQHYAEIRVALEARGTPIGGYDLLIAAHALSVNCVLVTDNVREFERVPGLNIENWLR